MKKKGRSFIHVLYLHTERSLLHCVWHSNFILHIVIQEQNKTQINQPKFNGLSGCPTIHSWNPTQHSSLLVIQHSKTNNRRHKEGQKSYWHWIPLGCERKWGERSWLVCTSYKTKTSLCIFVHNVDICSLKRTWVDRGIGSLFLLSQPQQKSTNPRFRYHRTLLVI